MGSWVVRGRLVIAFSEDRAISMSAPIVSAVRRRLARVSANANANTSVINRHSATAVPSARVSRVAHGASPFIAKPASTFEAPNFKVCGILQLIDFNYNYIELISLCLRRNKGNGNFLVICTISSTLG